MAEDIDCLCKTTSTFFLLSRISSFVLFYLFIYLFMFVCIYLFFKTMLKLRVEIIRVPALVKIIYWNKWVFLYYCNRRDRGAYDYRQEKPRRRYDNYCCKGMQRHTGLTAAYATEVLFTVAWRQKNWPSCGMTSDFQGHLWDRPSCGNRPRLWDWPCLWVLHT